MSWWSKRRKGWLFPRRCDVFSSSPATAREANAFYPILRTLFFRSTALAGKKRRELRVLDELWQLFVLLSVVGVNGVTQTFYTVVFKKLVWVCLECTALCSTVPKIYHWFLFHSVFDESRITSASDDEQLQHSTYRIHNNFILANFWKSIHIIANNIHSQAKLGVEGHPIAFF